MMKDFYERTIKIRIAVSTALPPTPMTNVEYLALTEQIDAIVETAAQSIGCLELKPGSRHPQFHVEIS
jgi:hypothetical protein